MQHVGVGAVAMPYLMILPFYWGATQANREYCASSWANGDQDLATKAAMATTRKQAELQLDAALNALKVGVPDPRIVDTFFDATIENSKTGEVIMPKIKELKDISDKTKAEALRNDIIAALANSIWNPTLSGVCISKKFGLWLGKPSSYSTKARHDGASEIVDEEFSPTAAFDLGFAPNAYFSLLVGATVGTFKLHSDPLLTSDIAWAGTIAVGGNLDLLGTLFK